MAFSDDLLQLDRPLSEGEEILTMPAKRQWPWNQSLSSYKKHETKAGLYLVRPHNRNGSVFTSSAIGSVKSWKDIHLGEGFFLEQTFTQNYKGSILQGSMAKRRLYSRELNLGSDIYVTYAVDKSGVPAMCRILYQMILPDQDIKNVYFEAYREKLSKKSEVQISGPHISTNLDGFVKEEGSRIDLEATLENLADKISSPEYDPEDIMGLFNYDYIKQQLLH